MSKVLVIDQEKKPLNPIHPARARILLRQGRAAVYRLAPFVIILKETVVDPVTEPLRIKVDPGSKITGLAIVNDATGEIVFAAEITHRGSTIKKSLDSRRAIRRNRRSRKTRYRQARFNNRRRPEGWLPPSLISRVSNVLTWVKRLRRYAPVGAISMELVKFDTQLIQNAEISGVQYQQGTLAASERRQYLLEKWGRKCAYCGVGDIPLQLEHIQAKSRGGSDRENNMTLACEPCNKKKDNQDVRLFLADRPEILGRILAQAKESLKDAAAVNSTRWKLYEVLCQENLSVECGSGGLTNYNRTVRNLPKTHWLDSAVVGKSTPGQLKLKGVKPLYIEATGHGSRQMCLMDQYGFPRTKAKQEKVVQGFRTGDMVRAVVGKGKKVGVYSGRVAVRTSGSFSLKTQAGKVDGINYRYCRRLQRADGYRYQFADGSPLAVSQQSTEKKGDAAFTDQA